MRNNLQMARLFQQNMQKLGRNPLLTEEGDAFGSTDMGKSATSFRLSTLMWLSGKERQFIPASLLQHLPPKRA